MNSSVMAGLVPAIHVFLRHYQGKTWMPGTRPGMTSVGRCAPHHEESLPPAAMQPQPLIGIFADPALDHRGNRLRRALNIDFAGGVAHRLYFVGEFGAKTVTGQADNPHPMYRAFDLPQ